MGTIRLGKRTDDRSPLIQEFVPLAKLDDLVFGGWDIFPDNAYQAASKAGRAVARSTSTQLKDFLSTIKPMPAGVRAGLRQEAHRDARQEGQVEGRSRRAGDRRHQALQEGQRLRSAGDGVVRLDRGLPQPGAVHATLAAFEKGLARERSGDRAVADLRLRGAQVRRAVRQRRAQPDRRHARAARAGARRTACRSPARTSRPARR